MANHSPSASLSASHATVTSQATSSSALPTDISPSSLDTLPILAAILTRLQTSTSSSTALTQNGSSSSPHPSHSQSQTQPHTQGGSTSSPLPSGAHKDLSTGPLTTKDIPAATDDLKSGLRKTRALIAQLPDIDRGVEEQEEEIRELEAKIREQRGCLEGLKALGGAAGVGT